MYGVHCANISLKAVYISETVHCMCRVCHMKSPYILIDNSKRDNIEGVPIKIRKLPMTSSITRSDSPVTICTVSSFPYIGNLPSPKLPV